MKPNEQELQEEQDILDAFEAGALKPVDNPEAMKQAHQRAAGNTFKKDARLNIRLSSRTSGLCKKWLWQKAYPIKP